jgi:limonene-1,2-epoxide hydrolase
VNQSFFSSIDSSELNEIVEVDNKIITRVSTTVNVPSENKITLEINEWYEIVNDKITSLRVYFDASELKKELEIE